MNHVVVSNTEILYSSEIIYPRLYHVQKYPLALEFEDKMETTLLEALKYLQMTFQREAQKKEPKKIL